MGFIHYINHRLSLEEENLKNFNSLPEYKKSIDIRTGIKIYESRISLLKSIKEELEGEE